MATVRVVYDSLFAAITGRRQESLTVNGETLQGLCLRLGETYGGRFREALFGPENQVRPEIALLVNGQRPGAECPLADGDEIVLLVPFAGG